MQIPFLTTIRSFNRNVHYYLLTTLLMGLSVDGVYAVLFNLYLLRLGFGEEQIGIINSAGLFTFALSSLPAGLLGTRFGSRRMLIVGVTLTLIGGALVPLSNAAPAGLQQAWIMGGYMILMSGFSCFFVNGSPFMMGSADSSRRNNVFSIQVATSATAGFLGSIIGGALPGIIGRITATPLTQPEPYRLPMLLLVLLMLPAILIIRRTYEPRTELAKSPVPVPKSAPSSTTNWKRFPILLVAVIFAIRLMQVAGLGATSTFINVYLDTILEVPTSQIGILTSLSRLIAVPAALAVPYLTRRFGNFNAAIGGSFGAALFILPIVFIPSIWAVGIGFISARAMTSIRFPSFQVYALELVEPEQQSMLSGVMGLGAGLSFATMAFIGGFVISNFSFQTLFFGGSMLTILGTALMWSFEMLRGRNSAETPVPNTHD